MSPTVRCVLRGLNLCSIAFVFLLVASAVSQTKPRARDLGIPFDGNTGPVNAITDVAGVEVGFATLISGNGKLNVGVGPVRTGVTAILPRGKKNQDPVFAGWYSLNGNGEMTGTTWVEESGFLGRARHDHQHSQRWRGQRRRHQWRIVTGLPTLSGYWWSLPVVAETYDGSERHQRLSR